MTVYTSGLGFLRVEQPLDRCAFRAMNNEPRVSAEMRALATWIAGNAASTRPWSFRQKSP